MPIIGISTSRDIILSVLYLGKITATAVDRSKIIRLVLQLQFGSETQSLFQPLVTADLLLIIDCKQLVSLVASIIIDTSIHIT